MAMLAKEMAFNQSCFGIRSNGIVNQHFLYYLTKTKIFELQKFSHGAVFDTITRETFANLSCKIPPIEKQIKIASILSTLDDKIEVNRRINDNFYLKLLLEALLIWWVSILINDNLEQQAQALFKSWFVDFEPFKDGEFEDSELGKIPKGWKVISLNDACEKITDGSHYSPKDDIKGNIPMLSVKDMKHNGFDYSSCKKISKEEYIKMKNNDCVPLFKDILVAKDGSYLKEIFICNEEIEQAVLSSIAIFRCNKEIIFPELLLQLLRLPRVRKDVGDNFVSGSALPRIVLKDFKKYRIIVAPIEIQKEVINSFKSINNNIYMNEKESLFLNIIRDNLLPRLMSGELKVNDVTI